MKTTVKYTSIIVITLLIGFAIGFLVNGRMTRAKISRWKSVNTEKGFHREFVRALDPTPEQMEKVKPILKKYGDLNRNLMNENRSEQKKLFTEMQNELKPFLTAEQIKRLERMKKRWSDKRDPRRNGKSHRRSSHKRE
jgi:hypothetical protein